MVVIPGDHVRIGWAPAVTVAEAYLHAGHLVEIIATSGRVWWTDPDQVHLVAAVTPPAPAVSEQP